MNDSIDKVRVLLPTFNQKHLIKKTLDSIKTQTFSEENIEVIIVDFGSDLEVYEWMFDYPLKHMAIYRKNVQARESLNYYMANNLSSMSSRMHNKFIIELQAGDVLYPDFISKCVYLMNKYKDKDVSGIIFEAIIDEGNGVLKKQKPIFSNDCIITRKDRLQYFTKGVAHKIIFFDKRKGMGAGANFDGWLYYDPHYWTYRFTKGNNENLLYIHEVAGSIYADKVNSSNMLQKMIATYVSILQFIRTYENSEIDRITCQDQDEIFKNCAHLSLVMACECAKQGDLKAAEDCCLFSKVIWLPIGDTDIYKKVFSIVNQDPNKNILTQVIDEIINEGDGGECHG